MTTTIKRVNPGKRFSTAVVHGDTVYLAGITADDTNADVTGQTADILRKIDKALAAAGTNKSKVLSAQVFITDITKWEDMNKAWDAWIDPNNMPVRATIECKLAAPKYLVEIMMIAAL
jgi:enamine deaminase RidA (YjgF/YER057c/UK114 family)